MSQLAIGKLPIENAKNLQDELFKIGIKISLDNIEKHCQTSCATEVQIFCNESDVADVVNYINNQNLSLIDENTYDLNLLNEVYDPQKEIAVCPACSFKFSTKLTECPECGLCF